MNQCTFRLRTGPAASAGKIDTNLYSDCGNYGRDCPARDDTDRKKLEHAAPPTLMLSAQHNTKLLLAIERFFCANYHFVPERHEKSHRMGTTIIN